MFILGVLGLDSLCPRHSTYFGVWILKRQGYTRIEKYLRAIA
jgi:hypothetical protein